MRGWLILRPVLVVLLILLLLSASTGTVSAQLPAKVETPYTLMDPERRTFLEGGIETPLKGNGPLTGYGYLFFTRPHFLDEDLYLAWSSRPATSSRSWSRTTGPARTARLASA